VRTALDAVESSHQERENIPNERELRIIELVAQGLKNSEIARAIGTTEFVVKNHIRAIYDKLGLWNRVEIALWYESRKQRKEMN
jgi:DNA-binding NarL/FixJ family response regulator